MTKYVKPPCSGLRSYSEDESLLCCTYSQDQQRAKLRNVSTGDPLDLSPSATQRNWEAGWPRQKGPPQKPRTLSSKGLQRRSYTPRDWDVPALRGLSTLKVQIYYLPSRQEVPDSSLNKYPISTLKDLLASVIKSQIQGWRKRTKTSCRTRSRLAAWVSHRPKQTEQM